MQGYTWTKEDFTELYRAIQYHTGLNRALQDYTVLYRAIQCTGLLKHLSNRPSDTGLAIQTLILKSKLQV